MTIDHLTTPASLSHHTLQRPDCTLHYWTGGNPSHTVIMMLHGATMDHRMFNAQVNALIDQYHIIVPDARGHGKSQPALGNASLELYAQDMLAILDANNIQSAIIIGQSFGGHIAQRIYKIDPSRIKGMVIIGSTPISKTYSKLEIALLKLSLPIINLLPYRWFTKSVAKTIAITDEVRAYALDAMQMIPRDQFKVIWRSVTYAIDTHGIPNLHLDHPLLLLHGDLDNTGTIARDMPIWATQEANADFHIIPKAGHNANQDNPAVTNQLILDFLHQHSL